MVRNKTCENAVVIRDSKEVGHYEAKAEEFEATARRRMN